MISMINIESIKSPSRSSILPKLNVTRSATSIIPFDYDIFSVDDPKVIWLLLILFNFFRKGNKDLLKAHKNRLYKVIKNLTNLRNDPSKKSYMKSMFISNQIIFR